MEFCRGLYPQQQTSSERNKSVYVLALSPLSASIFCFVYACSVFLKMPSKQEVFRERVVQSSTNCTEISAKKYTVQHFKSENVAASTVYHILRSPTTARKQGSGRPAKNYGRKRTSFSFSWLQQQGLTEPTGCSKKVQLFSPVHLQNIEKSRNKVPKEDTSPGIY